MGERLGHGRAGHTLPEVQKCRQTLDASVDVPFFADRKVASTSSTPMLLRIPRPVTLARCPDRLARRLARGRTVTSPFTEPLSSGTRPSGHRDTPEPRGSRTGSKPASDDWLRTGQCSASLPTRSTLAVHVDSRLLKSVVLRGGRTQAWIARIGGRVRIGPMIARWSLAAETGSVDPGPDAGETGKGSSGWRQSPAAGAVQERSAPACLSHRTCGVNW